MELSKYNMENAVVTTLLRNRRAGKIVFINGRAVLPLLAIYCIIDFYIPGIIYTDRILQSKQKDGQIDV